MKKREKMSLKETMTQILLKIKSRQAHTKRTEEPNHATVRPCNCRGKVNRKRIGSFNHKLTETTEKAFWRMLVQYVTVPHDSRAEMLVSTSQSSHLDIKKP